MVGTNNFELLDPMILPRLVWFSFLCVPSTLFSAVTYIHVDNYRGRIQNPFLNNASIETVFLEDFEIPNTTKYPYNFTNTPNASGWNGGRSGALSAGVREDYMPGDQDGGMGYYWTNAIGNSATEKPPLGIHFDFAPDAQGKLPEYVGAALRGMLGTSGAFNLAFVYDRNGLELTNGEWRIPKPDASVPVQDRFTNFEGIYVPGGISRIHFRDFREVDHLTYGYAIPELGTVWLAMGTGIWLLSRRR